MKKTFPTLDDKLYYSIGEVAKAFDVNTSLIRYWENEFPILKPKKNRKGNRYFTPEDIDHLKMIFYLVKEKGYTLDGAKSVLTTQPNLKDTVSILHRLEHIREELVRLKNYLPEENPK